jgi:large subunit ribosomal protein L17
MLANLATSLFKHGKITTTETKAKRLRPFAEQLITRAKRGDLASFRRVLRVIHELDVAYKLRDEIAPQFATATVATPASSRRASARATRRRWP